MSEIKPKNGEWWICEHEEYERGENDHACFMYEDGGWYQYGNCLGVCYIGPKPLYRISKYHPINDVIEATETGKRIVKDGCVVTRQDLGDVLRAYKIKQERPLIIPWGVIGSEYVKAKYDGRFIIFTKKDGANNVTNPSLLNIDITDVSVGATAERPEQ